jgi:endonuclease YncB( thermonuclease family)
MNGYDSPEIKPAKNNPNRDKEKEAAKKSKEALMTHFKKHIFIKIIGFDKYGRVLAEAYNGKVHINKWMIDNGYGYAYDGGKKKIFQDTNVKE